MKLVYVTRAQLKVALQGLVNDEHINIALCRVPIYQDNGIFTWERKQAAEALSVYYRRMAGENWSKHRHSHSKNKNTQVFAKRAQEWLRRAELVESIMLTWDKEEKHNEDHHTIV